MEKFCVRFPAGPSNLLPLAALDDQPVVEVGHELEVLLLLVHPYHLQLLPEQALKLFLEAEGECEPAHVAGVPALPEVDDALEVVRLLLLLLLLVSLLLSRDPVPS